MSMKCELCGKNESQLKIQQFIGSEMTELNICEVCAEERGIISSENGFNMSLSELLTVLVDTKGTKDRNKEKPVCLNCGTASSDIRRSGRVGCQDCYSAFRKEIIHALKSKSIRPKHRGKYPSRVQVYKSFFVDRELLRQKLNQAVRQEEYEKAAVIRDRLNELDNFSGNSRG
jgi:protein arginine kinase activator